MADLDQLQRQDAEIRHAECAAVRGVADHLREVVRDLPSESRLGLIFVRHADTLDVWATGREPAISTRVSLERMARELDELDDEGDE